MIISVFADTAYWIALANPYDQPHSHARKISSSLGKVRIVTSELVLIELLNYFADGVPTLRLNAANAVGEVLSSKDAVVIPHSSDAFGNALQLYRSRQDKGWSLTDCHSFLLMERHGIDSALTADRHFEQAGFKALIRQP